MTSKTLWSWQYAGPDTAEAVGLSGEHAYAGSNIPDSLGGTLATWTHSDGSGQLQGHVSRVVGTSVTDHILSPEYATDAISLVADGTAYLKSNSGPTSAVDIPTWTTAWSRTGSPILALDGHDVVMHDVDAQSLFTVNPSGTSTSLTPLPVALSDPLPILRGQGRLHGTNAATGQVVELMTAQVIESIVSFFRGPKAQDVYGPVLKNACVMPPPTELDSEPFHLALAPRAEPYFFDFVDLPGQLTWSSLGPPVTDPVGSMPSIGTLYGWNAHQVEVYRAFARWNFHNAASGLATHFAIVPPPGTPGRPAPDIRVVRRDLGLTADRRPIAGNVIPGSPLLPNGQISAARLELTTKDVPISKPVGYYKATLHEIGHILGLWHTTDPNNPNKATNGSSVMNELGFRKQDGRSSPYLPVEMQDDNLGNLPLDVTLCDRNAAKLYSTRTR